MYATQLAFILKHLDISLALGSRDRTGVGRIMSIAMFATSWAMSAEPALQAQDFLVNSAADTADANAGDGVCATGATISPAGAPECTLRAAIQEANVAAGRHKITVPAGLYSLTNSFPCISSGGLHLHYCVTGQIDIVGAGSAVTALDAGLIDRVMFIGASGSVSITGLTIQHGFQHGANFNGGGGGGIDNKGFLSVVDTMISFNRSDTGGGGIENAGTLQVLRTNFTGNGGGTDGGGGILNVGRLQVADCTFMGNAANDGSAIFNLGGPANISGSTFNENTTTNFGAGTLQFYQANGDGLNVTVLIDSTVANNVGAGVVVSNSMSAVLNNVTISGNSAGGLHDNAGSNPNAFVRVGNTILANNPNSRAPDCATAFQTSITSLGHNLIQDAAGCSMTGDIATNITAKDPLLGALADNGGLNQTLGLQPGSPAIGAGSSEPPGTSASSCVPFDQRGFLRLSGKACDAGAFQRTPSLSISSVSPSHGGDTAPLLVSIAGNGFQIGSVVKLVRAGQTDITGGNISVDPAGSSLSQTINLSGKPNGVWDIVVTNPDGASARLAGAFTIEAPQIPKIWTQVVSQSAGRPGRPARYTVFYGNHGNVDAYAVPVSISFPITTQMLLDRAVTPPPAQAGQVITDWTHGPVVVTPQTAVFNAPLLIPVIPASISGSFEFSIVLPATAKEGDLVKVSVTHGDPFFFPGLDPTVEAQMLSGAIQYAAQVLNVTVPPASNKSITTFIDNQLSAIRSQGSANLLATQNTKSPIYSLGELLIDAGEYAASLSAAVTPAFASLDSTLHPNAHPGGTPGAGGGCGGGVLLPGQSCQLPPQPVPDPDSDKPPKRFSAGDCRALPHHHVSADGTICLPDKGKGCAIIPNPISPSDPDCVKIPIENSVDPNAKAGAAGVTIAATGAHFVLPADPLPYTIFVENLATATAPAQTVTVTDQLDSSNLDFSTFSFGPISFGATTFYPEGDKVHFAGAVDLRPAQNLIVEVTGNLEASSGLVSWTFTSLDPDTGQLTTQASAGFLPPNVNPPAGQAKVSFSINPKSTIGASAVTCNRATVVFDTNAPINTPAWCNSYDTAPPTSAVTALPASEPLPSFPVAWTGTDIGSGIQDFTIFSSDNGGSFAPWLTNTTATSATFTGIAGHRYGFYSLARDVIGNVEASKSKADATTKVALPSVSTAQCTGCYFLSNGLRATIAFSISSSPSGILTYNYRGASQTVQFVSTAISRVAIAGNTALFAGQGKVNGLTGYSFTVSARDGGGVGSNLDSLTISITGPNNYSYTAAGTIIGGDIVVKP